MSDVVMFERLVILEHIFWIMRHNIVQFYYVLGCKIVVENHSVCCEFSRKSVSWKEYQYPVVCESGAVCNCNKRISKRSEPRDHDITSTIASVSHKCVLCSDLKRAPKVA